MNTIQLDCALSYLNEGKMIDPVTMISERILNEFAEFDTLMESYVVESAGEKIKAIVDKIISIFKSIIDKITAFASELKKKIRNEIAFIKHKKDVKDFNLELKTFKIHVDYPSGTKSSTSIPESAISMKNDIAVVEDRIIKITDIWKDDQTELAEVTYDKIDKLNDIPVMSIEEDGSKTFGGKSDNYQDMNDAAKYIVAQADLLDKNGDIIKAAAKNGLNRFKDLKLPESDTKEYAYKLIDIITVVNRRYLEFLNSCITCNEKMHAELVRGMKYIKSCTE